MKKIENWQIGIDVFEKECSVLWRNGDIESSTYSRVSMAKRQSLQQWNFVTQDT